MLSLTLQKAKIFRDGYWEQHLLLSMRALCVAAWAVGILVSLLSSNPHWFSRFGGLTVAVALFITFAQFRYEQTHSEGAIREHAEAVLREAENRGMSADECQKIYEAARRRLTGDIERMRTMLLINALLLSGLGELIHSFGDLVIECTEALCKMFIC